MNIHVYDIDSLHHMWHYMMTSYRNRSKYQFLPANNNDQDEQELHVYVPTNLSYRNHQQSIVHLDRCI
jgi:hypothetical protein